MNYAAAIRYVWGLMILAILSASCTLLPAPQPDSTRYFVLTAEGPAGGASQTNPAGAGAALLIGLGPVNFPDYLKRSEIVTRVAGSRLELAANDRWAEPLDETFKRILSHDLAIALGGAQVATFPWFGSSSDFAYRVEPVIDRFEADAHGTVHLTARWSVFDGNGNRMLYSSATDLSVPATPGDHAAMAAALSQAEGEFAGEIAHAIRRLHSAAATSQR